MCGLYVRICADCTCVYMRIARAYLADFTCALDFVMCAYWITLQIICAYWLHVLLSLVRWVILAAILDSDAFLRRIINMFKDELYPLIQVLNPKP